MLKRLDYLSAFSVSFLALHVGSTHAQTYVDYDPDDLIAISSIDTFSTWVHSNGTLELDLNGDGTVDFNLSYERRVGPGTWGVTGTGDVYVDVVIAPQGSNGVFKFADSSAWANHKLFNCDTFGAYTGTGYLFETNNLRLWKYKFLDGTSNYTDYRNWDESDSFLGVRVNVGGQFHYGWIRFGLNGARSVDATYLEGLPNTNFTIGAHPSEPLSLTNFTAIDNGSLRIENSLEVSFDLEACKDDSLITEYRLYIVPGVADPITLPNFLSIPPTGAPYNFTIPTGTLDAYGDSILTDQLYFLYLVAMPVPGYDTTTFETTVEISGDVSPAINIAIEDLGNSMNASDFRISLDGNPTGIDHYEVAIVPFTISGSFNIDSFYAASDKISIPISTVQFYLSSTTRTYNGEPIVPGKRYVPFVLSKAVPRNNDAISERITAWAKLEFKPYPTLPEDDGDDDAMW